MTRKMVERKICVMNDVEGREEANQRRGRGELGNPVHGKVDRKRRQGNQ